jgi:hypothetical protein
MVARYQFSYDMGRLIPHLDGYLANVKWVHEPCAHPLHTFIMQSFIFGTSRFMNQINTMLQKEET